jgi:hypothetical protein
MSQENSSENSYRFAYVVCAIFLLCFILMTCAVVSDAFHRGELDQVVSQVVPAGMPGKQ